MENKCTSITDRLYRGIKLWYHKTRRWVVYGRLPRNKDLDTFVCMNCGAHYQGHYCPDCGQESTVSRLKPSNALKNFLGGLTNIDRGFPRTCFELLTRPGYMIADFIAGRRIEYFKPFQMLFVLAMIYGVCSFLLNPKAHEKKLSERLFTISQDDSLKRSDAPSDSLLVKDSAGESSKIAAGAEADSLEEDELDEYIDDFADVVSSVVNVKHGPRWDYGKAIAASFVDWINENRAMQTVLFLPLTVIAASWSFRKKWNVKRYNWVELTFIHGYMSCQSLLISILMLPFARSVEATLPPYWLGFVLHVWCYYQLFKGSLQSIVGRTILVYLYMVLVGVFLFALSLFLFVLCIYWICK